MTRYFQHERGYVAMPGDVTPPAWFVGRDSWTEVQVAALDAVVIDGPLPEVTKAGGFNSRVVSAQDTPHGVVDATSTPGGPNEHAEWHRAKARVHAAMALHLDAHPHVDEKQVDLVQDVVLAARLDGVWDTMTAREQARYLVERGARVDAP